MPLRELLAPKPFRGDLIAAGAVALAVGVVLVLVRMDATWAAGVRCLVAAVPTALVLLMAWWAPVEGPAPRAYVSVLLAAGFPLLALTLLELADALGGTSTSAGTITWVGLLVGAKYVALAALRRSSICTLLGAVALFVGVTAAWVWVFDPEGASAYEWLSLAAIVGLALGAIVLRDHQRAHAVALIDAAGIVALWLAAIVAIPYVMVTPMDIAVPAPTAPWGWKLVLLAVGFGLAGYGAVDRERGPAWLGAFVLAAFVVIAAQGDLLWWPLILVAVGVVAIAAGLRPTTAAPPSPDLDAPEAPTRPFIPPGDR